MLYCLEERELINTETHDFVEQQYNCWNDQLRPEMAERGIRVLTVDQLDADVRAYVDNYCERELDPLLTPVTVDPAHPFPRVINKALCVALLLRRRRRSSLTYTGVVTVPRALPRLVRLPSEGTIDFVFLADLVMYHAARMYHGYDIVSAAAFRVTRNSNLYLQEEESRNLLESVRAELHNRRKGDAVRLEIDACEVVIRSASGEISQITPRTIRRPRHRPWFGERYRLHAAAEHRRSRASSARYRCR